MSCSGQFNGLEKLNKLLLLKIKQGERVGGSNQKRHTARTLYLPEAINSQNNFIMKCKKKRMNNKILLNPTFIVNS